MATLYWGGGSNAWDGFTVTGRWYTNPGRTILSTRAPSAEDDVIFDSASSSGLGYTVTISTGAVCKSCNISGPTSGVVTIAGSAAWFIYGDLTFAATGVSRTYTGSVYFQSTASQTCTTNGTQLTTGQVFINCVGGTFNLGSSLVCGQLTLSAGTFNTNGYLVNCGGFFAQPSVASAVNLGSSTFFVSNFGNFLLNDFVSFNAGTSTIQFLTSAGSFGTQGSNTVTFNNVTCGSGIIISNIYGNNVYNNFTLGALSAGTGLVTINVYGNQTINGTFTITGLSPTRRYFLRSNQPGATRTFNVAAVSALSDVDFMDIAVTGASAPWSGTRLGNALGNSGITFSAGVNKYIAAGTISSSWTATIWTTTSGGTASVNDFPLAQDDVIIDNAGLNSGTTLTLAAFNVKSINTSSRTNGVTLNINNPTIMYGDFILNGTSTFTSGSGTMSFFARSAATLNTGGRNIGGVTINSPGGTITLGGSLNCGFGTINLEQGTFDTANNTVTCNSITTVSVSYTPTRTYTFGSSTLNATTGVGSSGNSSGLTVTANTASIVSTSSFVTLGFSGITASFGSALMSSSSVNPNFYGNTTYGTLTVPSQTSTTGVLFAVLYGNVTVTGTFDLGAGGSVTQRRTYVSEPPGVQRTITAGTVVGLSDIDFKDIVAAGTGTWTGGTRIGDCGNNSGIGFDAPKTVYWNLTGTQNWSSTGWALTSGGSPAANNFPLAQDTAVFDDAGAATQITVNTGWNIGTIDFSARTTVVTWSGSQVSYIHGNVTYGSGVTNLYTGTYFFRGSSTQTFTTAAKGGNSINIDNPSCDFRHGDAFLSSAASITITRGSYSTQNYNVTCSSITSSNSNTRTINFGTSTISCAGTGPINFDNSSGLTFSGASSSISLTNASNKSFLGGGLTFGTVTNNNGTTANTLSVGGSNTFATLANGAFQQLVFTSGTTQTINNFTYTGNVSNVVRIYTSVPGLRATLTRAIGFWYAGANSTDGGNNSGWAFSSGGSTNYVYIKDISVFPIYVPPPVTANFLLLFE
jgi:hypothetical protein